MARLKPLSVVASGLGLSLLLVGCSRNTKSVSGPNASAPGIPMQDCTRIPLAGAWDLSPTWSPDGNQLAFVHAARNSTDSLSIHVVSVSDGSLVSSYRIADPFDSDLAWSPDGSRIAMYYYGDVWTLNLADGSMHRWSAVPPAGIWPTWSPDGRYILYQINVGGDPDSLSGLHLIDTRDGTQRAILRTGHGTASSSPMRISPDGKSIATTYEVDAAGNSDVYVLQMDGSSFQRLTSLNGNSMNPQWSPDGRTIWFDWTPAPCLPSGSPDRATWIVPSTGGSPRQWRVNLGDPKAQFGFPFQLSPDGLRVAYVGVDSSGLNGVIWTAKIDGTERKQLTSR